jgi:hypothetical protein
MKAANKLFFYLDNSLPRDEMAIRLFYKMEEEHYQEGARQVSILLGICAVCTLAALGFAFAYCAGCWA